MAYIKSPWKEANINIKEVLDTTYKPGNKKKAYAGKRGPKRKEVK